MKQELLNIVFITLAIAVPIIALAGAVLLFFWMGQNVTEFPGL